MNEDTLRRIVPKSCIALIKKIFDRTDLWFKIYLALSKKRVSSLSSSFRFASPSAPLVVKTGKICYQIDPLDCLQRRIVCNLYETSSLQMLVQETRSDGIFLDIGANVGFYSLNVASGLKERGKVYCFEADPTIFKKLEKNIALNNFQGKIEAYNCALSNTQGSLKFIQSLDKRCSAAGSLKHFNDIQGNEIEVTAITLDHFLEKNKISKVSSAKIDIEGSEMDLLAGAERTLREKKIENIFIEYNGPRLYEIGHSFSKFHQYFSQNGYVCTFNQQLLRALLEGELEPSQVFANFMFSTRAIKNIYK